MNGRVLEDQRGGKNGREKSRTKRDASGGSHCRKTWVKKKKKMKDGRTSRTELARGAKRRRVGVGLSKKTNGAGGQTVDH